MLHAKALHGNPFDGRTWGPHTWGPVGAEFEQPTGVETRRIPRRSGDNCARLRRWLGRLLRALLQAIFAPPIGVQFG